MTFPIRFTLKARFITLIVAVFLPTFGYAVYDAIREFHERNIVSEENLKRLNRLLAQDHHQYLDAGKHVLMAMSRLPEMGDKELKDCSALMTNLSNDLRDFATLGIANAEGDVICSSLPAKLQGNIADRTFFKETATTLAMGIGPYEMDLATNKAMVYIGIAIINSRQKLWRVAFGAIELSHFNQISELLDLPSKSVLLVFDSNGLILARYPDPFNRVGTFEVDTPLVKQTATLSDEDLLEATSLDGVVRLFAVKNIHQTQGGLQSVYLALGIPSEAIYGEAERDLSRKLIALISVLVLIGLIAWFGSDLLIIQKMRRLIQTTHRMRSGDLDARSGLKGSEDEVGQLAVAFDEMAVSMQQRVRVLEQHGLEMQTLRDLSESLQTCITVDEAVAVGRQFSQQLFPDQPGGLYFLPDGGEMVEQRAMWADPRSTREFLLEDCWATRRGKTYYVRAEMDEPRCNHVINPPPKSYVCVPLMAGGEVLGVFHLEKDGVMPKDEKSPGSVQLAESFAEHLALTLANLKLRETLHAQAMRDGLTGLYNRRFMEESLTREIRKAERKGDGVSLIMADIDYFKRFNDKHGHALADQLLRKVAKMFERHLRGSDLACRYGGEEFVIILPGASIETAMEIAEILRKEAANLEVRAQDGDVGRVTISLGVAYYPKHGETWQQVLHAADIALLQAKKRRNRTEVYD
jgi:diguanylate cyclase (GGDEF)-like protein